MNECDTYAQAYKKYQDWSVDYMNFCRELGVISTKVILTAKHFQQFDEWRLQHGVNSKLPINVQDAVDSVPNNLEV